MKLRIKEICKEKGVTMSDVAHNIGLSQVGMSNIVTGKFNPTLDTLDKIATYLNVPISQLFVNDTMNIQCPHCKKSFSIKIEK